MILIDTGTNTSTLSSTCTTICLIKFDGSTTHTRQGISEQRTEEHISLTCMNILDIHTHLLHDFHSIAETEDDTLLCCTNNVCTIMLIKADATNRTTNFLIL